MPSLSNPGAATEHSSLRRSVRLRHEDHPRKKRCVWSEVPVQGNDGKQLLDKPPKSSDGFYPGIIPNEILRGWGY